MVLKKKCKISLIILLMVTIVNELLFTIAVRRNVLFVVIYVIIILLSVHYVPICRFNENAWIYIMTSLGAVCGNIYMIKKILSILMQNNNCFSEIVLSIIIYLCLNSIEQLVIGIIGRMIYRKQNIEMWQEGEV